MSLLKKGTKKTYSREKSLKELWKWWTYILSELLDDSRYKHEEFNKRLVWISAYSPLWLLTNSGMNDKHNVIDFCNHTHCSLVSLVTRYTLYVKISSWWLISDCFINLLILTLFTLPCERIHIYSNVCVKGKFQLDVFFRSPFFLIFVF